MVISPSSFLGRAFPPLPPEEGVLDPHLDHTLKRERKRPVTKEERKNPLGNFFFSFPLSLSGCCLLPSLAKGEKISADEGRLKFLLGRRSGEGGRLFSFLLTFLSISEQLVQLIVKEGAPPVISRGDLWFSWARRD